MHQKEIDLVDILLQNCLLAYYIVMFKLRILNRLVQSLEFPPVQSLSILQTLPKAATGDTYKEQINYVIQQIQLYCMQ